MRKLFLLTLLLAPLAALGQVSNPPIVLVTSAPSGSCANGLPNQQVISTGIQYSCQGGTWGTVGTGAFASAPPVNLCSLVTLPSGTTCSNGVITIGTPTASVLISGIPAGYHNLVIDHNLIDSGGANFLQVIFNGSSAANYDWQRNGLTSAASGSPASPTTLCQISAVGAASVPGGGTFRIPQYDSTTLPKMAIGQAGEYTDPGEFNFYCGWNQTAAITSMTLTLAGGGNLSGSLTIQGTN